MDTVDQIPRLLLIVGGTDTNTDGSAEGDRVTDGGRRVQGIELSAAKR